MTRPNGRQNDQMRPVKITPGFIKYPDGSVLIEAGDTRILCSAMVEEKVPPFLKGSGSGWVTAEYSLLPASTQTRTPRDVVRGRVNGRTSEIQRLIGRSLRAVVDFKALGERTIWIDCDVIQADGGTRTASITGSFVALYLALHRLKERGVLASIPIIDHVAAVSVGIVGDQLLTDLEYVEDSRAEVDMNVVMTGRGSFVELQGTAEGRPFTDEEHAILISLARQSIMELVEFQKQAIAEALQND